MRRLLSRFCILALCWGALQISSAHSTPKDARPRESASGPVAHLDCPGGCDDANPCTDDLCDASLGCVRSYNTLPCTDANACTTNDACAYGSCVGGDPGPGCAPCSAVAVLPPGGGVFTGTTSGGSTLVGSCFPGPTPSPERVFRFTPLTSGMATIETCGPQTTFDTILYARAGTCTGSQLACNDDSPCVTSNSAEEGSRLQIAVTAGQTYYVVVDGYSGGHGAFQLKVTPPSTCGNGAREGDEECDGADSGGCGQGACDAACHCTPTGSALPDLIVQIVDWFLEPHATVAPGDVAEGCAEQVTGSDLLRFGVRTRNIGTGDMVLGAPQCPTPCTDHPLEICANSNFICSPAGGHNHGHYLDYASYELLDAGNELVVIGHKQGFCLHDGFDAGPCPKHQFPGCDFQGMSAGCADLYEATLGCQYLDITSLPAGEYTLRVRVDPLNRIPESREDNNVVTTPVTIPADPCTAATSFAAAGGTIQGTTAGTSTRAGSCASSGTAPEQVFSWTPTHSGVARVETCNATATGFDTVVYVRGASCDGAEAGCNDDGPCASADPSAPQSGSRLDVSVIAGQTYFVFVDGYQGAQGAFSLTITPPAIPSCGANGLPCNDADSCTTGDACSGNVCVGTPLPAPDAVNDSVRLQRSGAVTTLAWQDAPGPFAVYRGSKESGAVWADHLACLAGSIAGGNATDATTPGGGTLLWYLVTREGPCAESVAGVRSDGAPVVPATSCP